MQPGNGKSSGALALISGLNQRSICEMKKLQTVSLWMGGNEKPTSM
jgi:hypothetical protein